jgi:hypothetical protein
MRPGHPFGVYNSSGGQKPSWTAFHDASFNSLDCRSIITCKNTRPGDGCDTADCPAIRFTLGRAQTVHFVTNGYAATQCAGSPSYREETNLDFPSGGEWIVGLRLSSCPAPQYSANWVIGLCNLVCGNYGCSDPLPNCDSADSPFAPSLMIDSN